MIGGSGLAVVALASGCSSTRDEHLAGSALQITAQNTVAARIVSPVDASTPPDDDGADAGIDGAAACQPRRLGTGVAITGTDGAPLAVDRSDTLVVIETRAHDGDWQAASDVLVEWDSKPLLDVAIVADTSGSEYKHLTDEKNALQQFASRIFMSSPSNRSNRVGLVRVSTGAKVYEPLTTNQAELETAIGNLFIHHGWTALWDGLRKANEILAAAPPRDSASCYPGAFRSIVAFTDGRENNSSAQESIVDDDGIDTSYADVLGLHVGAGQTAIYTVGVGRHLDEPPLQALSAQTGGQYARIEDWSKLADALERTAASLDGLFPVCFVPPTCDAVEGRATVKRRSDGALLGQRVFTLP